MILTLTILGLQVIKVIMLICFRNKIAFGWQILAIFIELIISTVLAVAQWNLEKSLSAYLLSLCLSLLILTSPLVRQHLHYISIHMTQKELVARQQTAQRIVCDDTMINNISCGQKIGNLCSFFFCRKVPRSEI